MIKDDTLAIRVGSLQFDNPFIAASGTYGYGTEWGELSSPSEFGAIVSKGITLNPQKGNPNPRLVETSCGLINSIGLENPGIDAFIAEKLPEMRSFGCKIIVNINGESEEEFGILAKKLQESSGVDAIEVNVSCPNVSQGGMAFGIDEKSVERITRIVRNEFTGPLIVKLTPNVTDIRCQARAALEGGADILSIANTYVAMSIDVRTRGSRINRDYGGYSGSAIKPLTLHLVHQVYREFKCPIIGSGGIYALFDCLEYFIAGAGAAMLGTVNFTDPMRVVSLKKELLEYLKEKNVKLPDLVGSYIEFSK